MERPVTQEPGFVVQACCMLAVCGPAMISACSNGFPTLVVALAKDNSTDVTLDQVDLQWLVTAGNVVGLIGPFLAGVFVDVFGPRLVLVVSLLLPVILWPVIAFLPLKPVLWASRIGISISGFTFKHITSSLSAELVSPNIRGFLGALPPIYFWTGTVIVFSLIKYLSWNLVCLVIACPALVIMIALCFVPESPYWLIRKGRIEDARRALATLRGDGTEVDKELESIQMGLEQQPSFTVKDQFAQLIIPSNYKALLLMMAVHVASNMTGFLAIFQYAYMIVPGTGVTDLDPMTGIITLAMAGCVSSGIASFLLDRCGRRPLLIGSALVSAASLLAASMVMIYPVLPDWVALLFIHGFIFGSGLGSYTVPTVLTGEMIPTAVRYIGVSICLTTIALTQSLLAYAFPVMVSNIGLSYTFMTSFSFSIILAVLAWKWIPETRGKSLVQLQKVFTDTRSHRLYSRISICKESSKAGIDISPEDLKRLTEMATNVVCRQEKDITRRNQRSKIFGDILQEYNENRSKSI